jgi:DNA-directed RNA polymerase specialized sigma24 family protein
LKTREATVTTRLYRARLRLAKELEQREGLSPSERQYE